MAGVRRCMAVMVPLLALSGCYGLAPGTEPGSRAHVEWLITRYYDRHAIEEHGSCTWPELRAITAYEVLEDSPERLVVGIRYYYRDDVRASDEGPLGIRTFPRCEGFASRVFSLDRTTDPIQVIEMSGPQGGRLQWSG